MTAFVHHHDAEKLGYLPLESRPPRPVQVRVGAHPVRGDTVFLVAGIGPFPRRYYLWEQYEIDKARAKKDGFFVTPATMQVFDPPRRIAQDDISPVVEAIRPAAEYVSPLEDFLYHDGRRAVGPMHAADDFSPLEYSPFRSGIMRAIADDGKEPEADAEHVWSEIIALRPDDGDAYDCRGRARRRARQFEGASADLEKASDLGTLIPQSNRGGGAKAGTGDGSSANTAAILKIVESARTRLGQARFRRGLFEAYGSRCALTDCDVDEVLSAAHIIDHHVSKSPQVTNGILLRADIHLLFDRQLLRICPDTLLVVIDKRLEDTEYGDLSGRAVRVPEQKDRHPSPDGLRWRWDAANRTPGLPTFERPVPPANPEPPAN